MKKYLYLLFVSGGLSCTGLLVVPTTAQVAPDYQTTIFNNAVRFRAASAPISIRDFGQVQPHLFSGNFTVEFWAKVSPDFIASPQGLLHQPEGSISVGLISFCTNPECSETEDLPQISFQIHITNPENDSYYCFAPIPGYNEWFHVALVADHISTSPGEMHIFINGRKQPGSVRAPGLPEYIRLSDKPLIIGDGIRNLQLDELRMWNIPKLESGVQATMNEETSPYINGLVAYYDFNEPDGSGINRVVPNKSRGAGSPTSDSNGLFAARMGADQYGLGVYPEFRLGKTFVALQPGDWHDPIVWAEGEVPDASEVVTIDLAGSGDLVLPGPVYATSVVFKNGRIRTNDHTFTTSVPTAGSRQESYIITDGETGGYELREGGSTYCTMPVGNDSEYLPLKIRRGGSGHTFFATARVKPTGTAIPDAEAALNVPWELTAQTYVPDAPGGPFNVKFHWYESNEGAAFDRQRVYIANYHNGVWQKLGTGEAASDLGNGMYAIAVDVTEFSEFTGSSSESSLPVTLEHFRGSMEKNVPVLRWATTYESNSERFNVERSSNGRNWTTVGSVLAGRESTDYKEYQFADITPVTGIAPRYYRLKMVDSGGAFTYSTIIRIDQKPNEDQVLLVYPNAASDRVFISENYLPAITSVRFFTLTGTLVKEASPDVRGIRVSDLPEGMYLLRVIFSDGATAARRLLVKK